MDYNELLGYYTHRGFRVIACATRHIPKMSWLKTQKLKRSEAESDLEFVGFIVFENKLKLSTSGVIHELKEAGIREVMCTGDNILTAISVARECNLIDRTAHCFVPHFVKGSLFGSGLDVFAKVLPGDPQTPDALLTWESVDNQIYQLDEHTLLVVTPIEPVTARITNRSQPLPPPAESDASLPYDVSNLRNYSIAVSGDVFRWVIDFGPEEVLQRVRLRLYYP